jgi:thymidine phosphorylase
MSKKLAEGLNGLVLDVKTGLGAQMKALEDSKHLAEIMVGIGNANRVRTIALITDMSQPLGMEVGNANEIRESISVLKGEGPPDVTALTMALGEVMLELAGVDGGRDLLQSKIDSGEALRKLKEVAVAQDGDPTVIDDPSLLPQGRYEASLPSPRSGYVQVCDALRIGTVVTRLGAGRVSMGDNIDPGVGVTVHKKVGDIVAAGDNLATVVHNDSRLWGEQREALFAAWTVGDERVAPPQLIVERIE